MKIVRIFVTAFLLFIVVAAKADEGMWLPQLLSKLNEDRMKSLGMKISAKDIYDINSGSLKDAIVSFGGFCTGSVISSTGLILTNHHCGFGAIQNHSTLQNNYIRDGFWAKTYSEEIANKGLFATFIKRIDDVSNLILKGVTANMSEAERQSVIDKNIAEVRKNAIKKPTEENFIRGFFEANQYYLFTTETFNDVRLVGAPPSAIGNFGKDTDNWVWPRHTGDFSLFRIYANKENMPANYSPENVPYKAPKPVTISLKGIKENDFTMVYGFPGRTNEYLYSDAVRQIVELSDPVKINIRTSALQVIDGFMRKDELIKIQYAAKYANIANAWKKWQGEVLGLTKTNAVNKKLLYETEFQKRVNANTGLKEKYGSILNDLKTAYNEIEPYSLARDYYGEIINRIELLSLSANLNTLITSYTKDGVQGYEKRLPIVLDYLNKFYKEYNSTVDKKLFEVVMPYYINQQSDFVFDSISHEFLLNDKSAENLASKYYKSMIIDSAATLNLLKQNAVEVITTLQSDVALKLFTGIQSKYQTNVQEKLNPIQAKINVLQRTYMQAQMEVMKDKTFYPDANSTLRLTYGKVKGYYPRDGVYYQYSTWLDGVMEKYKPGDYEFDVPEKLRDLYAKKDYGIYGVNGKMPVCFIATNHTTGGNSGSPVFDAYGRLIGLNFDRVWEGTMSDINYDASICRNIQVDIRYVLFIIDKFAGAKNIIKELNLVKK
ncbi:MAG: S46 family peptidase [Bacteroidetes bacterium]|nr:S46 family peptidase [Bacteroidota bacterium]